MKILVNDIAASSGGAISILTDFYNFIVKSDKENEWIFLLSDKYLSETKNIRIIVLKSVKSKRINRLIFDLFSGRKLIKKLNPDVIFSLQNTVIFGVNIPEVLYIHQSIPFQKIKRFSFLKANERKLAVYQYIIGYFIKLSALRARKVIVQTNWMKNAIIESTMVDKDKIKVIPPNLPKVSSCIELIKYKNKDFFYPAGKELYKNHECIYEACKILNKSKLSDYIVELTLNYTNELDIKNIRFIGCISREEVMDKYKYAVLIFPSYIETYGLPLAEARSTGSIILASDCEFSREVLEDYENAYYFNPFNPYELANLMKKVINGQIMRIDSVTNKTEEVNKWQIVKETIISHK